MPLFFLLLPATTSGENQLGKFKRKPWKESDLWSRGVNLFWPFHLLIFMCICDFDSFAEYPKIQVTF